MRPAVGLFRFRDSYLLMGLIAALGFAPLSLTMAHAQRAGASRQAHAARPNEIAPAVTCSSGTNNWTGGAGDNKWTTAGNWSTGAVPTSTNNVCIASTFTSTITIGTLASTNQTIASLDSGAPLALTTGPLTISGTATFAADLNLSGTLTLDGTSSMTTLEQSGGTLSGTGTLSESGLLTWSGGTESGSGVTNANGGMTISGEPFLDTRTLNNAGTATWSGAAFLILDGAVLNNKAGAIWNHQVDTQIQFEGGATPTFNNSGTFEKTGGTGVSGGGVGSGVVFNNTGSVQANSGVLPVSDNGSCSGTCGGSWSVVSGATLQLGSGTTAALSGTISGAGTVSFTTGTVNYTGMYNVTGGTTVTSGTANFNSGATLTSVGPVNISNGTLNFVTGKAITTSTLTQSAGTLTGSDTLTVSGAVTWSGGTESGSGVTNANGGMTISGEPFLDTRTLNNAGTATWSGAAFLILDGAVLNNKAGAIWNHQVDTQIQFEGGTPNPTFNNSGTFEKTGGTGVSGGGVGSSITFNNSGTVIAKSGTLLLGNFFTQTKGSVLLEGGNISLPGTATLTETGGSVLGIGTITGGVTNTSGVVSPTLATGAPTTGTLTINGSGAGYYTQGAGGTLLLDFAGSAGGQFDVLSASGPATLAGSAELCLIKGFKPTAGTAFPIVDYASETGTFSKVNFGWSLAYNATSVVATYNGAPSDVFTPPTLAFPSQLINTTSSPLTVTLSNAGTVALTITSITQGGPNSADFTMTGNTCGSTLAAGAKCTITETFTPSALGSRSANITVADNACASPHVVPLTGKGTEITMAPSPVSFGSETVGTTSAPMTVTVTNNGTTAVKVTSATITGANKGDFAITSNTCTTISASGGTCSITITFTPAASGARTATLSLTDNDKGSPQTDVLSGTGTT